MLGSKACKTSRLNPAFMSVMYYVIIILTTTIIIVIEKKSKTKSLKRLLSIHEQISGRVLSTTSKTKNSFFSNRRHLVIYKIVKPSNQVAKRS